MLGNEYKFENGEIKSKPTFGETWWPIAHYHVNSNTLKISCIEPWQDVFNINIISLSPEKLVLDQHLNKCVWSLPIHEKQTKFELFSTLEGILDSTEKLISMEFSVQPEFLYRGLMYGRLDSSKRAVVGFYHSKSIDTTFTLSSLVYDSIEYLIQMLPLELFEEKYKSGITDGANFNVTIVTNKVLKQFYCQGSLPDGLINLIQYADYKLEEQSDKSSKP